ncbi:MCE family protein [Nocardioides baekrokdamisoli]|nr:MCE family protein [Nocardioides baekrokdamisoli]
MLNKNRGTRPPTKNQLALRGLIFIGIIALLVGLIELQHNGAFGGQPKVTAQLRNAGGSLPKNSDVKDNGVILGFVSSVSPGPNGLVDVQLTLKDSTIKTIPAGVVARILPANVFGTSYVDLALPPDATATGALQPGATIPADTRFDTIELQNALDDIDRLVKALSPKDLSAALGAISHALDGRGTTIGQTAVEFDNYLKVLQPEIPTLRADIAKSAQALGVVNKVAPGLLNATGHALNLLDTFVQHQADLDALLKSGINLANTSSDFLAKNSPQLIKWLHDVSQLTDALYDNRRLGITGLIQVNALLGQLLNTAVTRGYVRVDINLVLAAPRGY